MSRNHLSAHLLPVVVVAPAAALVLGGTAVAAKLVTGADVADHSLTGKDIAARSVPGTALRPGAVNRGQLGATVLRQLDAPGPRGPRGATGSTGATGPMGSTGPAGPAGPARTVIRISTTVTVTAGNVGTAGVNCHADEIATGGGVSSGGLYIRESYPTTGNQSVPVEGLQPKGWRASGQNVTGSDGLLTAYVVCAPAS